MGQVIEVTPETIQTLKKPVTRQLIHCLISKEASDIVTFEMDLTLATAMDGVLIRNLNSVLSKKNVVKAITYLTLRISEHFNVGKKFTPAQASVMALDLSELMEYETLEDIVLMFKWARQGKLGDPKMFKLDGQTVFHHWVPQYLEMKAEERENGHRKSKGELSGMLNFKWDKEALEKFVTSDKRQNMTSKTEGSGIGSRIRHDIGLPKDYVVEPQTRENYLRALRSTAEHATIANIKKVISNIQEEDAKSVLLEVLKEKLSQ